MICGLSDHKLKEYYYYYDWIKKCSKVEVVGKVGRGRGRKTWLQCVNSDMKDLGLRVEEAQDRQL